MARETVAVVGSGISGLASAWLLARQGHTVTLYEANPTCGGHTLTDDTAAGPPVDLGFQVFNLTTYPHFTEFLEALGVESEPSDMSFSLSLDGGALEWASHGVSTVFAQRGNVCRPSFLRMLWDVLGFAKMGPAVLAEAKYEAMTLGEFVQEKGLSHAFVHWYLLPMVAAVWSCSNADAMDFSIRSLVRFWTNHHLIDALGVRPNWRVVKSRSKAYVDAVLAALARAGATVLTSTPVASVTRASGGNPVRVVDASGTARTFDRVVMACHSDTTLKILGKGATAAEKRVLGAIEYQANDVWLHSDPAMMPANKRAWASWNVLDRADANADAAAPNQTPVTVTYWLNHLQNLPKETPLRLCTLNPSAPPAKEHQIRQLKLSHPVLNAAASAAQREVPALQGVGGVYYAGAWCGYGFHEDGIKSAIAAVDLICGLGGEEKKSCAPWSPRSLSPHVTWMQSIFAAGFDRMAKAGIKKGELRLVLPDGNERVYGDATVDLAPGVPPQSARVRIMDMNFFQRVAKDSDIGLGEAFMYHEFETDDLPAFIAVAAANGTELARLASKLGPLNWIGAQVQYLAHLARSNTIAGSRKNINEHYDIGNDLFSLFLDDTMTYSSAIFPGYDGGRGPETVPGLPAGERDEMAACADPNVGGALLRAATNAKLDEIIAKAKLTKDDHVVEIGCGWGSFAIRAARTTGCTVTGITISTEQLDIAKQRVAAAGLSDRVNLVLCDYRKLKTDADLFPAGGFDKLVSIEMLEAVGHENLQEYFDVCSQLVRPTGLCVIQVITIPDERYEAYCKSSDFIKRHIFPGGHLPAKSSVESFITGLPLDLVHVHDIGPQYAPTLRMWRLRFVAKKEEILALGYSDVFYRKWIFYFAYCEAAFANRYLQNYHYTFVRTETPRDSDVAPVGLNLAPGVTVRSAKEQLASGAYLPSATKSTAVADGVSLVVRLVVLLALAVASRSEGTRGFPVAAAAFLFAKLVISYGVVPAKLTEKTARLAFRNACAELLFAAFAAYGLWATFAPALAGATSAGGVAATLAGALTRSAPSARAVALGALGYVAVELADAAWYSGARRERHVVAALLLGAAALVDGAVPANLAVATVLLSALNDGFNSARIVLIRLREARLARTVAANKRGLYDEETTDSAVDRANWVMIVLSFFIARVAPHAALLWWSVLGEGGALLAQPAQVGVALALVALNADNAKVGVAIAVNWLKDSRENKSDRTMALGREDKTL